MTPSPREGLMAKPTAAGLTMKTHRRASWKSAAIVASPDMTFKAREVAPSSSGTIGRRQKNQATNAAMPKATITATSLDPVKPIAAANAKIPKAQASDSAIKARSDRAVTVPGGSVVWVGMCALLIVPPASHFVLGSDLRDSVTLPSSGFTCLLLIANETVATESGKIQSGSRLEPSIGISPVGKRLGNHVTAPAEARPHLQQQNPQCLESIRQRPRPLDGPRTRRSAADG